MNDYETVCIVSASFATNAIRGVYHGPYELDLAKPEGEGWKLIHILPVHNNPNLCQFFWERVIATFSNEETKEDNFQLAGNAKIKLTNN